VFQGLGQSLKGMQSGAKVNLGSDFVDQHVTWTFLNKSFVVFGRMKKMEKG